MYIKIFLIGILWMSTFGLTYGRPVTSDIIFGTVKEANGEPLAGANVYWLGTSAGTVTGAEGAFRLEKASGATRIVAVFIGYMPDTLDIRDVNETLPVEFVLHEDAQHLGEVTVTERRLGMKPLNGVINGLQINQNELFKAACCNLGESFTTNPSVDVNYSDAATGARQIKMLGLSGIYVQMLTENLPNFRGAAAPYALGYVPGPWMKSIQVSKGASSVRNGYESITGQIDVEYLKPDDEPGADINLYGNSEGRMEANVSGNIHLKNKLNTEILAHYEDNLMDMDENRDGFLDKPNVRQLNLQNRWDRKGDIYIFHGGVGLLSEKRESGQTAGMGVEPPFEIGLKTNRYEGYMKHAFILDKQRGTNIAFMGSASLHRLDGSFGYKHYSVNQKNAYAQFMFETNFSEKHNLSTGVSLNYDGIDQHYNLNSRASALPERADERETTPGVYAQYTLNLHEKWILMAGIRADHSSLFGTFVTPRFHLKYNPSESVNLRFSAGKGYRTVHALAENNFLLASGRSLLIDELEQEKAWNYGGSALFYIPVFGNVLKINTEYYYTHFGNQAVIDYDSDPFLIRISNLNGRSYSHTFQVDATYPIVKGLELSAAYRLNDVKTTYGGVLQEKPLTSKYKGLMTASYKTPLGKWQFDATLQLNGSGRMPAPYRFSDGTLSWNERFPAFEQLNVQITRWFRHFSVYIGGENLTGFRQKNPIVAADRPWSRQFEPTLIWGPVNGAMAYAGIRINIGRIE